MADENLAEVVGRGSPNGVTVLIVGSGIGGLSAARELWRIGCDVRVYERQASEVLTGDSFSIGPSALESLRNFPSLEREVDRLAFEPVMYTRKLSGELLRGPVERNDMLSAQAKGAIRRNLCRHSRPSLYLAMLKHLQRAGVPVDHGCDVQDYFEDGVSGRAGIVLKDGSRKEADLVIAADGVHGRSWRLVQGHETLARPSGDAMFRVAFPAEIGLKDPAVAKEFPLSETGRPQVNLFVGQDVQVAVARQHDELSWSLMHQDDGRARESWEHHPPIEKALEWLAPHPEVPDTVKRLMHATPQDMLVDYRIMWRDPESQWTSPAGRVIQLGDAAHTFHPSSGNGGTQAMEDAVSLAKCLEITLRNKQDIAWATRVSNLLRFERVSCLQAFGIYNAANRKKGGKPMPELGRWIVAHDPEAYAEEKYAEALSHLQNSTPFQNTNTPPGMVYRPWTLDTLIEEKERGEPNVLDGDWS